MAVPLASVSVDRGHFGQLRSSAATPVCAPVNPCLSIPRFRALALEPLVQLIDISDEGPNIEGCSRSV